MYVCMYEYIKTYIHSFILTKQSITYTHVVYVNKYDIFSHLYIHTYIHTYIGVEGSNEIAKCFPKAPL